MKGFSLLEVLIVVGILAVLAGIGTGFYFNYAKERELEASAKNIIFDLKQAQAKAMAGEESRKWGAHFINNSEDYYEIFSTPTDYNDASKAIETTSYLASSISFTAPVASASSTVIFDKIKGTTVGTSIITISSMSGGTKTITVTAGGNIY